MNLLVFESEHWGKPLDPSDHRARHLVEILKLSPGDEIRLGRLGDGRGTGTYLGPGSSGLEFSWPQVLEPGPAPYPVTMIIGTPRPPTARRLLKDLTALGAAKLWFTASDLGEKSYLQSSLWKAQEYRENLLEGAQQAQSTDLPEVQAFYSLGSALKALASGGLRLAPDLPRHGEKNTQWPGSVPLEAVVAIGPERGWSDKERDLLTVAGFLRDHLGPRNLRTETACTVALSQVLARYWWKD